MGLTRQRLDAFGHSPQVGRHRAGRGGVARGLVEPGGEGRGRSAEQASGGLDGAGVGGGAVEGTGSAEGA